MAEDINEVFIYPQKNSQIVVNVEEVLEDVIVVSFSVNNKLFQGALLDSRKTLPACGITAPPHIPPPLGTAQPSPEIEDKFYSVSQRFSYFQEKPLAAENGRTQLKRNIRPPARFRNTKMTVRLRPRQVLCSKCRGICNENSENVDSTSANKKRKTGEQIVEPPAKQRGDRRLRSSGEVIIDPPKDNPKKKDCSKKTHLASPPSLIPKLSRLGPKEITNAMNGKVKIKIVGNYWLKNDSIEHVNNEEEVEEAAVKISESTDPLAIDVEDPLSIVTSDVTVTPLSPINECDKIEKCDEKTLVTIDEQPPEEEEDPLALADEEDSDSDDTNSATRVLRKKRSVGSMEDLWDETVFEDNADKQDTNMSAKSSKTPVIKISFGSGTGEGTIVKIPAKVQSYIPEESEAEEKKKEKTKRDASAKAAKKALKKAKKEARRKVLGNNSPARSLGGASPRYPNMSPRYAISCGSPRYNLGSGSPRYNIGNSSPAYEIFHTRKHKHKVKHKKKHKDDRKQKDIENIETCSVDEPAVGQEQCLKQKLSINLKRLNAHAYIRCETSSSPSSDLSDDHSDTVPDFPGNPLMMRISSQTTESCKMSDGRFMNVGDVVWGKIHGFPWWPGKVLSITVSRKDESDSTSSPQAHVAWYGSSTSSLMSCEQLNPFLETFQIRYNKKKRGPYKEAIKQATNEAKKSEDLDLTTIYASPSEVDVVS